MGPDVDTLATALYVRVDDLLADHPEWAPQRPKVGIAPRLADAELVTLAVISALLGFDSERRFVHYAKVHLGPWFPYVPTPVAVRPRFGWGELSFVSAGQRLKARPEHMPGTHARHTSSAPAAREAPGLSRSSWPPRPMLIGR